MTTATNSPLLDRKLEVCFGHLDPSGTGAATQTESRALTERIVTASGAPADSPKAVALWKELDGFWNALLPILDANNDGAITEEEWVGGLKKAFHDDPNGFNEGFRPLAEAIWQIFDIDGDGRLEAAEFAAFHGAFGTSESDSQVAFSKLDRNGDGSLSVEELLTAFQEYYTSTDADARGNYLYGDVF